eukprot:5343059-Pyramimonas_sp.AAC.1
MLIAHELGEGSLLAPAAATPGAHERAGVPADEGGWEGRVGLAPRGPGVARNATRPTRRPRRGTGRRRGWLRGRGS